MGLEAKNPNNAYSLGQVKIKNSNKTRACQFLKKEYKDYKAKWIDEAKNEMKGKAPCSGNIFIQSNWEFGTKRKKDLPNCGKFEFDALNGVVYDDDSQIMGTLNWKEYKKNDPYIIIEIYEMQDYDGWEV